jgi:hypothetical protein
MILRLDDIEKKVWEEEKRFLMKQEPRPHRG